MSTVKCSFNRIVGGNCSYDPKHRKKSTEILPLQSCKRDITGHKSLWSIPDVENEVELILARASIFLSSDHRHLVIYYMSSSSSIAEYWLVPRVEQVQSTRRIVAASKRKIQSRYEAMAKGRKRFRKSSVQVYPRKNWDIFTSRNR